MACCLKLASFAFVNRLIFEGLYSESTVQYLSWKKQILRTKALKKEKKKSIGSV